MHVSSLVIKQTGIPTYQEDVLLSIYKRGVSLKHNPLWLLLQLVDNGYLTTDYSLTNKGIKLIKRLK